MSDLHASDFALTHRAEILGILERLRNERTLTTIEFAAGHAIVSSVLAVRRDSNALVFDVSRDPDANRALFSSPSLAFVTELDDVQITFETRAASLITAVDGPAAVVDLPLAITRLQRREWFRAALPVEPPIRCTVMDPNGNASPARAIDLSCGGVGVLIDEQSLTDTELGSDHAVIVSLPDLGPLAFDTTLCTVRQAVRATPDAPTIRLGFRFEHLPAKTANQIQRYVQRLEVNQLRVLRLRSKSA